MPRLKNIKHELFCQNLIKHKGNQTKAYQETYPDSSYSSSNTNAPRLIANESVQHRLQEILNNDPNLSLQYALNHIKQASNANTTHYVDASKKKVVVPDNKTRLEATKTLLKLYGLGKSNEIHDNRSINYYNVNSNDVNKLQDLLKDLKNIKKTRSSKLTGEIKRPKGANG